MYRVFADRMLSARSSRGLPRPESSGLIRLGCDSIEASIICLILTHLPLDTIAAISQTICSDAFSWRHYLNQCWPDSLTHVCGTRGRWVKAMWIDHIPLSSRQTIRYLSSHLKGLSTHYMMTSSNGNIFRLTSPLCGEFTGHRWIPLTKASDAELWCFLWSSPE